MWCQAHGSCLPLGYAWDTAAQAALDDFGSRSLQILTEISICFVLKNLKTLLTSASPSPAKGSLSYKLI